MKARAAMGDSAAQNALGVLYYIGAGTPRDYAKAIHWFERAALAGHPQAQRHLGSMFRQGLGTPKDDFRAFGWYDAAYRSGDPNARAYMKWCALVVGANQQALGRRLIAKDLKAQAVSHGSDATGYR
ncbi:MAG: tetratricopeptide repeat protein [Candidatus Binataceae bacterium]